MPRLTDADRRRLRWLARCLAAIASAPESYRLSVHAVVDRLADPDLPREDAEAMLDTLGSLTLATLEYGPETT